MFVDSISFIFTRINRAWWEISPHNLHSLDMQDIQEVVHSYLDTEVEEFEFVFVCLAVSHCFFDWNNPLDGEPARLIESLIKGTLFGEQSMMGGLVVDDYPYSRNCKTEALACAKAEFALSRREVDVVLKYISDIEEACNERDKSRCTYHLIGRNCVDFVIDVAKVAKISDNFLARLKVDDNPKKDILERSILNLNDKAWKYVYFKTSGQVNIQDPRVASN